MKKQIVMVYENPSTDYTAFAAELLRDTEYEIISASADKSKYEAVIFIFDKEVKNDCRVLNHWVGHSHLRSVWGENDTEKKEMLKKELLHIAGIPVPLEIEKKFLIEYPDISMLKNMPNCCAAEIEQTYLTPTDTSSARVRKRTTDGKTIYIKTEKKKITDTVRIETEEEITLQEYENLRENADANLVPIRKTRYCLMHNGKYFEIDIFPFWIDKAYVEIELTDENEYFELPEFLKVIKEVTQDKNYTNRALAYRLKNNEI